MSLSAPDSAIGQVLFLPPATSLTYEKTGSPRQPRNKERAQEHLTEQVVVRHSSFKRQARRIAGKSPTRSCDWSILPVTPDSFQLYRRQTIRTTQNSLQFDSKIVAERRLRDSDGRGSSTFNPST